MGKRKVNNVFGTAKDTDVAMAAMTPGERPKRQRKAQVAAEPVQVSAQRVTRGRARRDKAAVSADSAPALTVSECAPIAGPAVDLKQGQEEKLIEERENDLVRIEDADGKRTATTGCELSERSAAQTLGKKALQRGRGRKSRSAVSWNTQSKGSGAGDGEVEDGVLRAAEEVEAVKEEAMRAPKQEGDEMHAGPVTPYKAHGGLRPHEGNGQAGSDGGGHQVDQAHGQSELGSVGRDEGSKSVSKTGASTENTGSTKTEPFEVRYSLLCDSAANETSGAEKSIGPQAELGGSGVSGVSSEQNVKAEDNVDGSVSNDPMDEVDSGFWAAVIAQEEAREKAEKERKQEEERKEMAASESPASRYQVKVQPSDLQRKVWVNRGPVLTLWAAIVAQHEGYTWQEAVTFGRAIAGNCANMKGRRLGLTKETAGSAYGGWEEEGCEEFEVFGMKVLGKRTKEGIKAVQDGIVVSSAKVEEYLHKSFSFNIEFCKAALGLLVSKYSPANIGNVAFRLYEDFRPSIPDGVPGWGAKGVLDLSHICALANRVSHWGAH